MERRKNQLGFDEARRLFGIKVDRDPSVLEQCRMQFNSVFSVPRTGSTCFLRGGN